MHRLPKQHLQHPATLGLNPWTTQTKTGMLSKFKFASLFPSVKDPKDPFERRNLSITINLVAILHKMTKNNTHRNLLLVGYKSSAVLKRVLKIHSDALHYYTLKVLKSQVPFLGRKWRNANMRIISLVYMELDPRLNEDYLAGEFDSDADRAMVFAFFVYSRSLNRRARVVLKSTTQSIIHRQKKCPREKAPWISTLWITTING
jgi:hypothetical protein